ncbi:hypothetical protein IGI04_002420 [Brassica rapa subsp. trilocularis]|uniref:Uncharacterized protein n=1 Tax=Brassica rapa subsp. trilocularis TaxID=1813537 RepID=A0ABQ7NVK3_BRACM|nr:hypothetical protein IGI04_002420 [Brassica rapa subsp. trilocularis]
MGNLNTPNYGEGATDPGPAAGVAGATREGAENPRVHNLEESDSEPELLMDFSVGSLFSLSEVFHFLEGSSVPGTELRVPSSGDLERSLIGDPRASLRQDPVPLILLSWVPLKAELILNPGPASSVSEDDLVELRRRYSLSSSTILRILAPEERASSFIPGHIAVYEAFFDTGFRGVIPALVASLCDFFRISPSKLNPPSWRLLVAIQNLGDLENLSFGINEVLFSYHLAPLNGNEGRLHLRPRSGFPIVEELQKGDRKGSAFSKKWHERYVFVMLPGHSYQWTFIAGTHPVLPEGEDTILRARQFPLDRCEVPFLFSEIALHHSSLWEAAKVMSAKKGSASRTVSRDDLMITSSRRVATVKIKRSALVQTKKSRDGGMATRSSRQSVEDGTILPSGEPSEVVKVLQGGLLRVRCSASGLFLFRLLMGDCCWGKISRYYFLQPPGRTWIPGSLLELSAEKLNQLQTENAALRDQNKAPNTASNKKRRFNTRVRPMGSLSTPNTGEGTTNATPASLAADGILNQRHHKLEAGQELSRTGSKHDGIEARRENPKSDKNPNFGAMKCFKEAGGSENILSRLEIFWSLLKIFRASEREQKKYSGLIADQKFTGRIEIAQMNREARGVSMHESRTWCQVSIKLSVNQSTTCRRA